MDRRALKNFLTKRSTIWTLSLCLTGAIALGSVAAVNNARKRKDKEAETEIGQVAYLEEEVPDDIEDELFPTLGEDEEDLAQASGNAVEDTADGERGYGVTDGTADGTGDGSGAGITADTGDAGDSADASSDAVTGDSADAVGTDGADGAAADGADSTDGAAEASANDTGEAAADGTDGAAEASANGTDEATAASADATNGTDGAADGTDASAGADGTEEAASGNVISEQTLLDAGVSFTGEDSLMWPSAGTILIDYSMDGSVYFPTLNQYKYNPALIIGSEAGNQVLASAKGIVESVSVNEETGTTLVLNIGNGYRLTYGQLKELAVAQGDVVEAGTVLGYVSEPTKYYSEEGSNLYFAMTQNNAAVDPILYLE